MERKSLFVLFGVLIIVMTACVSTQENPDPLIGTWVLVEGDLDYQGIAGFVIKKAEVNYLITLGEHREGEFNAQDEPLELNPEGDIYVAEEIDVFRLEIKVVNNALEVRILEQNDSERTYRFERL